MAAKYTRLHRCAIRFFLRSHNKPYASFHVIALNSITPEQRYPLFCPSPAKPRLPTGATLTPHASGEIRPKTPRHFRETGLPLSEMTTSPAFTRRHRLPAASTRLACALAATSGFVLTACSGGSALSAEMLAPTATVRINLTIRDTGPTPAPTLTPLPTPILPTPEPTVSPIVARVNGQDISREAFNQELHRYLTADPSNPAPDSPEGQELAARLKDTVLEAMIEQAVIEQEAAASGTAVTDAQVDQEFNALIQLRGGRDKLDAWLAASNQTEQEVREWVRRDLVVNAMRDRIVAQLPRTAEYVHAYHIVVASETEAADHSGQAQQRRQIQRPGQGFLDRRQHSSGRRRPGLVHPRHRHRAMVRSRGRCLRPGAGPDQPDCRQPDRLPCHQGCRAADARAYTRRRQFLPTTSAAGLAGGADRESAHRKISLTCPPSTWSRRRSATWKI